MASDGVVWSTPVHKTRGQPQCCATSGECVSPGLKNPSRTHPWESKQAHAISYCRVGLLSLVKCNRCITRFQYELYPHTFVLIVCLRDCVFVNIFLPPLVYCLVVCTLGLGEAWFGWPAWAAGSGRGRIERADNGAVHFDASMIKINI